MANEIKSDEVVQKSDVNDFHRQWTDRLKLRTAQIIVGVGLVVAAVVLFCPIPWLTDFHQNAWTLITVIVSSALGFLYSARDKN